MDERIRFLNAAKQAQNRKRLEDVVEELKNEIVTLKQQIKEIQGLLNGCTNKPHNV